MLCMAEPTFSNVLLFLPDVFASISAPPPVTNTFQPRDQSKEPHGVLTRRRQCVKVCLLQSSEFTCSGVATTVKSSLRCAATQKLIVSAKQQNASCVGDCATYTHASIDRVGVSAQSMRNKSMRGIASARCHVTIRTLYMPKRQQAVYIH